MQNKSLDDLKKVLDKTTLLTSKEKQDIKKICFKFTSKFIGNCKTPNTRPKKKHVTYGFIQSCKFNK